MQRFKDRTDAGKQLASALLAYAHAKDAVVLALPRGGVPVAYEIAQALHLPLDVYIVRKLGVPFHPELAFGALASGGVCVYNEHIIQDLGLTMSDIKSVIAKEQQELVRREITYRGGRPPVDVVNKTVILVDDGVATGASMRAAITALRKQQPQQIIVAVPVADPGICESLANSADKVLCLLQPPNFQAVGLWYDYFSQTEDEEVQTLLKKAYEVASLD